MLTANSEMKMILLLMLFFIIGNADASEGENAFFNLNLLWSVINFVILLYILYYFNKKSLHIGDYIKNRRAKFEKEVEDATKEREDAEKRYQELTAKKENLEKEIITLKNQAMSQMEVQKKTIEENAKTMSERIKKEAGMIAEAEIARIRKEIRDEIIELATKKAVELIKEKFSEQDQERIEQEFISEIKKRRIV